MEIAITFKSNPCNLIFPRYFIKLVKEMGKRACPFKDSFTPQLKVHISEKECKIINLQKIQNKTLSLLFHGSKTLDNKSQKLKAESCFHCLSLNKLDNKCWFCDNILCSNCVQKCVNCSEIFCRNCAVTKYDDQGGIICLTCVDLNPNI